MRLGQNWSYQVSIISTKRCVVGRVRFIFLSHFYVQLFFCDLEIRYWREKTNLPTSKGMLFHVEKEDFIFSQVLNYRFRIFQDSSPPLLKYFYCWNMILDQGF